MNNKNKLSNARYIATSAMLTSLCCIILSLGSVFESFDLSFSTISAIILWITLLEFGKKTAWSVYITTSLLSFILIPSKFPSLFFITITGWYPMIKLYVTKKIKNKRLLWFIKLIVFNISSIISVILIYLCSVAIGIEMDESITQAYIIAMLVTANFAFIITDMLMDILVKVYLIKIRKVLKKMKLVE